jgi:hypothetical protein
MCTRNSGYRDIPFDVPQGGGRDNGFARIRIQWSNPVSDFDLYIYKDADNDNNSDNDGQAIASSAAGTTDNEQTSIGPDPSGHYVARVVNFSAPNWLICAWVSCACVAGHPVWTPSADVQCGRLVVQRARN